MNRVFGIVLCMFSLVGLVSSPALAAISCAMKCQEMQPAIEMVQGAGSISYHCPEMEAAALAAMGSAHVDNLSTDAGDTVTDMGCDCPDSCSLTAPAVLSDVEVPLSQLSNGDIFVFSLRSVEESFRSRLYRPPIA